MGSKHQGSPVPRSFGLQDSSLASEGLVGPCESRALGVPPRRTANRGTEGSGVLWWNPPEVISVFVGVFLMFSLCNVR